MTRPRQEEPRRVRIPFKARFREPMLNGTKIYTVRTKRMGEPSDTFVAFGATFWILHVSEAQLFEVAALWQEEGCMSKEDFIAVWKEIHPVTGYHDYQYVYLHEFRRIP